jgi:hypothetical protein
LADRATLQAAAVTVAAFRKLRRVNESFAICSLLSFTLSFTFHYLLVA